MPADGHQVLIFDVNETLSDLTRCASASRTSEPPGI